MEYLCIVFVKTICTCIVKLPNVLKSTIPSINLKSATFCGGCGELCENCIAGIELSNNFLPQICGASFKFYGEKPQPAMTIKPACGDLRLICGGFQKPKIPFQNLKIITETLKGINLLIYLSKSAAKE